MKGHVSPRAPGTAYLLHSLTPASVQTCFLVFLSTAANSKRYSLRNILPTKFGLRESPFPRDRFVTVKRRVVETPGTQVKEERKVHYFCLESEKGLLYLYTLHSPQGPTKAPWLGRLMSKNSCVKEATPNPTSCDLGPLRLSISLSVT